MLKRLQLLGMLHLDSILPPVVSWQKEGVRGRWRGGGGGGWEPKTVYFNVISYVLFDVGFYSLHKRGEGFWDNKRDSHTCTVTWTPHRRLITVGKVSSTELINCLCLMSNQLMFIHFHLCLIKMMSTLESGSMDRECCPVPLFRQFICLAERSVHGSPWDNRSGWLSIKH